MKRNLILTLSAWLLILSLILTGCSVTGNGTSTNTDAPENSANITLDNIPEYSGSAYVEINGNKPFFEESEITSESFESYSPLDSLGRCGVAFACVGKDTMPDEDREGSLSSIEPSGWVHNGVSNNNSYEIVSGGYVYNRCHLIGYQLTGETTTKTNLITGTRYFNVKGMLRFENMVADFIRVTGIHVMYRVTPIYDGYNLVASGVLMEGYSVEDEGDGIYFCVYVYNVQPGIEINYFNGTNRLAGSTGNNTETDDSSSSESTVSSYIINTNSEKIHKDSCATGKKTSEANREDFTGTLEELRAAYPDCTECGSCKPFSDNP